VIPCVSQSIQKVQLGCIDFIAAVVMKDLEGELLGKVIQIIEKNENETLSVLMCHVMTSTSRLLSAKQMIKFSEISMKSLIKCSMKASSMVRCASLQSLLHFSYQLKASVFPYTTRLFDVTISALKSTDSNVRLLGLKLFSALLVSREDIIQDHQHQFLEIQKLLGGLSLMDNDSEVRKLAENLVSTLFQSK
jgi:thymidylate kinase